MRLLIGCLEVIFGVPPVDSCGFAQEVEEGSTEEHCIHGILCKFRNKIEDRNKENTDNERFDEKHSDRFHT